MASKSTAMLEEFVSHLKEARFVAIDCEFSGIGKRHKEAKELGAHLSLLRKDATDYAMLQIGFCIVQYDENDEKTPWSLFPYNIYTFPANDSNFTFNSTTLKWLHDNGFDFNRWIVESVPYRTLVEESEDSSSAKKKKTETEGRAGVQRFIDAIISHRKPIVVHNGLLDVFHIYNKFIGALPQEPKLIVEELHRIFGFGIFDTKNVARYLHSECKHSNLQSRSLGSLHEEFSKTVEFDKIAKICKTQSELEYSNEETASLDAKRFHEAGFDATITAMVFIAELRSLSLEEERPISNILEAICGDHEHCGKHVSKLINCINIHDPIDVDVLRLAEPGFHSKDTTEHNEVEKN